MGNLASGCGSVELIASLLAVHRGAIPPILNCDRPDPEIEADLVLGSPAAVGQPDLRQHEPDPPGPGGRPGHPRRVVGGRRALMSWGLGLAPGVGLRASDSSKNEDSRLKIRKDGKFRLSDGLQTSRPGCRMSDRFPEGDIGDDRNGAVGARATGRTGPRKACMRRVVVTGMGMVTPGGARPGFDLVGVAGGSERGRPDRAVRRPDVPDADRGRGARFPPGRLPAGRRRDGRSTRGTPSSRWPPARWP